MILSFLSLALLASTAFALPPRLQTRSISELASTQISSFDKYTYYASAAFCDPFTTLTWTCGPNCDANPEFRPVASGGDGATIQRWYVGYDPVLKSVIVTHQGTDISKILPIITDTNLFRRPLALDFNLFPGLPWNIKVHSGFVNTHSRAAPAVLSAVKVALSAHDATQVTMIGHSLGAAIALLDSLYLPLHLPNSTTFKTVIYGTPRVGNKHFADYVDAHTSLTFVNNKRDVVPAIPPRVLGFVRPSGEIHITNSNAWMVCSGQENTDVQCSRGEVPNFLAGIVDQHRGPFNGITIDC